MKDDKSFKDRQGKGAFRAGGTLVQDPGAWRDEVYEDLHFRGSEIRSWRSSKEWLKESWESVSMGKPLKAFK